MLPKRYLRFRDLKDRGIVGSWSQLRILIERHGFPAGRLLSPQVRLWIDTEIEAFLASRPVVSSQLPRGGAKRQIQKSRERREIAARQSA